jgi:DNA-binding transcriptional ArsR family regulator
MAVTLSFPSARPVDLIDFGWSPLFEAALSMRVLARPKRTPLHLPWVRRCRDLPEDLRAELRALVRPFDVVMPGIFEAGLRGDSPVFADEVAALAAIDLDRFAYEVTLCAGGLACIDEAEPEPSRVHDAGYRAQVLGAASDEQAVVARAAFEDPAALQARYVRLVERYWDAAFAEEWERILPRIEAEVTAGARALVTAGAPGLVSELLPEGRWDADRDAIVIAKDWEGSCDVAERGGLLLVPTVYGWPNVLVDITAPGPAAVFFPLRDLRTPEVPHASDHEVVEGLRALGDETRLQITRLVAEDARSTKELAALLSLSDSAVSRHLKILESVGLVSGQRDGYFVLYRLEPERLDVLARALRSTLGLSAPASGDVPALPVSVPRAR